MEMSFEDKNDPRYHYAPPPPMRNGLGVAALVCGLIGFLSSFGGILTFWLSVPLCILGIVFGFVGVSRVKKGVADNKNMSRSGWIMGVLGLVVLAVYFFVTVAAVGDAIDDAEQEITDINDCYDQIDFDAPTWEAEAERCDDLWGN